MGCEAAVRRQSTNSRLSIVPVKYFFQVRGYLIDFNSKVDDTGLWPDHGF